MFILLIPLSLAVLLLAAGCMSSTMITNTDPFQYNYTPVANAKLSDPEAAFEALVELLEAEGYTVAANAAFSTATTFPRQLGYLYWRANRRNGMSPVRREYRSSSHRRQALLEPYPPYYRQTNHVRGPSL